MEYPKLSDIEIDEKIKDLEKKMQKQKGRKTGLPSFSSKIDEEELDDLYKERAKRKQKRIDDILDDLNSNGY